jgi:REP element-mobilizing transposase RayT
MSRVGRDRSEESIKGLKEFDVKIMMKKHWMQILERKYLLSQSATPECHALMVWHSSPAKEVMEFYQNELYHIYNRGNNRRRIFYNEDNYIYFLKKVRKFILPYCEILSYCLMPNHFHFLIYAVEQTIRNKIIGGQEKNILSEGIRNLLQTYTKGINKQNNSTGSLFQQNTKAKIVSSLDYGITCLNYIHQNPIKARLVRKIEDWPYCSFPDFIGKRAGTLCNKKLAFDILKLNPETFYDDSYRILKHEDIEQLF